MNERDFVAQAEAAYSRFVAAWSAGDRGLPKGGILDQTVELSRLRFR